MEHGAFFGIFESSGRLVVACLLARGCTSLIAFGQSLLSREAAGSGGRGGGERVVSELAGGFEDDLIVLLAGSAGLLGVYCGLGGDLFRGRGGGVFAVTARAADDLFRV